MKKNWREREQRAVIMVRWDLLPVDARLARQVLCQSQWEVLRLRAQGQTCTQIAGRRGCSKQAVKIAEARALEALAKVGQRAIPSVSALLDAHKGAEVLPESAEPLPADHAMQELRSPGAWHGPNGLERVETALDKLADAFIAGDITWQDAQAKGRELTAARQTLDA